MKHWISLALTVAFLGGCTTPQGTTRAEAPRAVLFEGMGNHHFPVTTKDAVAQTYFDQGLTLCYAFNHGEAVESFQEAARLDPDCAMAWWGQAYALGPYFNRTYNEKAHERAFEAIQRAVSLRGTASPLESDLIDALAHRFASPPPRDRAHLDKAYADAMERVWERHGDDDDVAVLYADARMNQHRWDLWSKSGQPNATTMEAIAVLERAMDINEMNPGANHLYIHALEASPSPEKAEAAADRLLHLVPGDGHLVHMPSHIYAQVDRYVDAVDCNRDAAQSYRDYFAAGGEARVYGLMAHDTHFLMWCAMFQGREQDALDAYDTLFEELPEAMWRAPTYRASKYHVLVRFGRWDDILATEPPPEEDFHYLRAMWHYARGIALANTGRIDEARTEAQAFEAEVAQIGAGETLFFSTPVAMVMDVARHMLAGETEYKAGNHDVGLQHLRSAVQAEDALPYMEPSHWMMPTRHALGALLIEQGRIEEAEECYRQDLEHHPGNVWSLHGLTECLQLRGAETEARDMQKRLGQAEAHATLDIRASCFCREEATVE